MYNVMIKMTKIGARKAMFTKVPALDFIRAYILLQNTISNIRLDRTKNSQGHNP